MHCVTPQCGVAICAHKFFLLTWRPLSLLMWHDACMMLSAKQKYKYKYENKCKYKYKYKYKHKSVFKESFEIGFNNIISCFAT